MAVDAEGVRYPLGVSGSCQVIAWSSRWEMPSYGIYRLENPTGVPVPRQLRYLIDNAFVYPVALALAFEEVRQPHQTRGEFLARYERILRFHLENQPRAGYVLARCIDPDQGMDLFRDQYYWVLKPSVEGKVFYMAPDRCIYDCPASCFDLPAAGL